jgi:hypothetical protein
MHEGGLEDRLRTVLRGEGDALPLTITTAELERRRALRQRGRLGRRATVLAAAVVVVAVGSLVATTGGWFRPAIVGSGPSSSPTTTTAPSEAAHQCETIDPASMSEPPNLLMGTTPGDDRAWGGLGSSYRLADKQVGEEGTWDRDSIAFETVNAGFPTERIQVLASGPDACLIGIRVDGVPSEEPGASPIRLADMTSEPTRVLEFDMPPTGDWLLQVHAAFATVSGTYAWRETFFALAVPDCTPLDPTAAVAPPTIGLISSFEGSGATHAGTQVASAWNGESSGSRGTWDGLPTDPDQVLTAPGLDGLQISASACLVDIRAEALLTVYAELPEPAPTPIELEIRRGEGSPVAAVVPPPTGGWTLRIRASFLTTDGSEAWSETLFRVFSRFPAPGLTVAPDFFEVMSDAHCPSYQLKSGASASDQCEVPYELVEGRDPIPVASGTSIPFRLEDGWIIDEARTVAVDAELVARGDFAPEYSVDFQENVGATLTVPIILDPGAWIVRISLNATRNGDTFGALYDIAITVVP